MSTSHNAPSPTDPAPAALGFTSAETMVGLLGAAGALLIIFAVPLPLIVVVLLAIAAFAVPSTAIVMRARRRSTSGGDEL